MRSQPARALCRVEADEVGARAQVESADVVLVNKTDCLPPDELPRLLAVLGALNPGAPLIPTEHGRVAPGELMGARRFDADAAAERPGWLRAINTRAEADAAGPSASGHAHAHGGQELDAEKYVVSTFVYHARRCGCHAATGPATLSCLGSHGAPHMAQTRACARVAAQQQRILRL